MPDDITLTIGSQIFNGWTDMSVSRSLDRMASHFRLAVTSPTGTPPFGNNAILPFSPCVVKIGGTPVLTGFIDEVEPDFDDRRHFISVVGRSKTCDLVDCTPDIKSGQFRGYTLEQIARAICKPFNIDVVVQAAAGQIFPDVTLQRSETAFTFLERLGRLAGVLLTDNEMGQLLLTTAGSTHATGRIVQGQNVVRAHGKLSGAKRFSEYIVKGQRALGSTQDFSGLGGIYTRVKPPAPVVTNLKASASDSGVPRYRPHVSMAEAQLDQAGMQRRATWERNFALGRSVEAEITLKGWRQGGLQDTSGPLWRLNQLVSTTVPYLGIDQDLLSASVDFRIDDRAGKIVTLRLGPIDGYTPDPGEVKLHARRGKKGKTVPDYDGLQG